MIQQKLKLRQQYIETLSLQMNEEVENIQKEFFKDVKFEKKVKDIRRINDLNKNGLEDKRKEVERLDKLVQGKNNKKKFFNKKNKKNKQKQDGDIMDFEKLGIGIGAKLDNVTKIQND